MLIYNIPYRTAVNLSNDSLLELAEVPNIVGVKDSSGSLAQSLELLARKPEGFSVLTGEDALYFTMMANGADGGILAASHLMTERFLEVGRRFADNDVAGARAAWAPLASLRAAAVRRGQPDADQVPAVAAGPDRLARMPPAVDADLRRAGAAARRRLRRAAGGLCARLQEIADLRQQLLLLGRRRGRRRGGLFLPNRRFMPLITRNSTQAMIRKFTVTVMNWP